jgi:hypothetical protein
MVKSIGQTTKFGQLFELYLKERNLTQLHLERALNQNGYPITNGLISKYIHGKIKSPPDFIYAAAVIMELTKEEADALIEAHLADEQYIFWRRYKAAAGKDDK